MEERQEGFAWAAMSSVMDALVIFVLIVEDLDLEVDLLACFMLVVLSKERSRAVGAGVSHQSQFDLGVVLLSFLCSPPRLSAPRGWGPAPAQQRPPVAAAAITAPPWVYGVPGKWVSRRPGERFKWCVIKNVQSRMMYTVAIMWQATYAELVRPLRRHFTHLWSNERHPAHSTNRPSCRCSRQAVRSTKDTLPSSRSLKSASLLVKHEEALRFG